MNFETCLASRRIAGLKAHPSPYAEEADICIKRPFPEKSTRSKNIRDEVYMSSVFNLRTVSDVISASIYIQIIMRAERVRTDTKLRDFLCHCV